MALSPGLFLNWLLIDSTLLQILYNCSWYKKSARETRIMKRIYLMIMNVKESWKQEEVIHQSRTAIESNNAAREKLVYALFVI